MNLRKNIRKILKENIDDLSWIKDIKPNPIMVGTLIFVSPMSTNKVVWVSDDPDDYLILRITRIEEEEEEMIYYDLVVSNIGGAESGHTELRHAKNLVTSGYWRVLSNEIPKKFITPQDGSLNANEKIKSMDILPYIVFDGNKMNVNKLYESDDLDWIRNLGPTLPRSADDLKHFVGWSFLWDRNSPHAYWDATLGKIVSVSDEEVNYTTTTGTRTRLIRDFLKQLVEGRWVLLSPEGILFDPIYNRAYLSPLKESDELEWIRDTDPKDTEPRKGDKIRVHNLGTEETFLNWLSIYETTYTAGAYGPFIEGEVVEAKEDENFRLREKNTNAHIYFPTYKRIPTLNNTDFEGLDFLYEFI